MKKADIEVLHEYAEGHYNGVFINGDLLCICYSDTKSDAVRNMIDALIDMRAASLNDNRGLGRAIEKAEEALTKAGVEL